VISFVNATITLWLRSFDSLRQIARRHTLQRFFCTFPGQWPGVGLLLLRAIVGATAVVQGGMCVADRSTTTVVTLIAGFLSITSGALLLIGFLTPLAGLLVGLGSAGISLSLFPSRTLYVLDLRLAALFVAIVALAIVFLGPGAFSLDSRLFGRREVIIPATSRSPKS